jgi:hypothetical protein
MDIGNLNSTQTTIEDIPEGECFVYENDLYIRVARSGSVYEDLIKGANYLDSSCICVRLSDGVVDAFNPPCPCRKVLTKVSVVPG